MAKPTPEQLAEFKRYEEENVGKGFKESTLREVVNDDVNESEKILALREKWDRNYNHKPEHIEHRTVEEE